MQVERGLSKSDRQRLIASLVGLGLAAWTLRSPMWLYGLATTALVAWVAWVVMSPAV